MITNRESLMLFKKSFNVAEKDVEREELIEEVEGMLEHLKSLPECEEVEADEYPAIINGQTMRVYRYE